MKNSQIFKVLSFPSRVRVSENHQECLSLRVLLLSTKDKCSLSVLVSVLSAYK